MRVVVAGLVAGVVMACVAAPPARAADDNSACWGDWQHDATRPDMSCTRLTERLLTSLQGATLEQVKAAMKASGKPWNAGQVRFLSNHKRGARGGSGTLTVEIAGGRVSKMAAVVDGPGTVGGIEYLWTAPEGLLCSDFPGSRRRCQ